MRTKSVLNGKEINLTGDNTIIKSTNFNVDKDGNMTCKNANITGGQIQVSSTTSNPQVIIKGNEGNKSFYNYLYSGGVVVKHNGSTLIDMFVASDGSNTNGALSLRDTNGTSTTNIDHNFIYSATIKTDHLVQSSLEQKKKNFEKMKDGALKTIKSIDIYKYNLKTEKDTDKKHIGFVIGNDYNYSKEVTSIDNQGVDNYSFTSLCCKAIQEQQEQIEKLQGEIEQKNEIIKKMLTRIEKIEGGR